ncbi:P-loop containing nucleoside triphosphate hydrolase protein [Yarrowia lipolytica]|uniref:P-loop containing nucleoside triphosphate hydrolase protein n=1 Tax=Yarrowia lipolytica TaxID=4952 RepID=A0A371C1S0_YARLL|nr:P-loop containing nucleoside triphosphate hydrolase protein [Yarrowia lipolytica]
MSYCTDPEGWQLLTRYYDLSPCLSQNGLFILPGAIAILFGAPGLYNLSKLPGKRPALWDYNLKQIITILQIAVALAIPLLQQFGHNDLRFWSPLILAVGTTIVLLIQKLEFEKRQVASTAVLTFWGLEIIEASIAIYGFFVRGFVGSPYIFAVVSLGFLGLFSFILEARYTPSSEPAYYDDSNFLSKLTYSYVAPILDLGNKETLKLGHIPKPPRELLTENIYDEFSQIWDDKIQAYKEKKTEKFPSVLLTLASIYGLDYLKITCLQVFCTAAPFVQPLLLKQLILFVGRYNENKAPLSQGLSIVIVAATVMIMRSVLDNRKSLMTLNLKLRFQTSLSQAVHEKALKLAPSAVAETSIGELVNILSNNVTSLSNCLDYIHTVWSLPLQIVICWTTMYSMIGNAMWVGMAAMLVVVPITALISKMKMTLYLKLQKVSESRYTLTNELLSNMKSVKLYGWESTFFKKVEKVRNEDELGVVLYMTYLTAVENFLFNSSTYFSSTAAFAFIVLFQHLPLSAASAIPALNLFGRLLEPFINIPYIIQFIIQAWIALDKINRFLGLTEVEKFNVQEDTEAHADDSSAETPVNVHGTFCWDSKFENVALENITYSAKKGNMVCIIGKVGAGKTATLMATLGELFTKEGSSWTTGSVAYFSQVPWILNATVKDNILFGSREDPVFYNLVIEACALTRDMELLADGDMTEVGEKGISLSGGQKARIAIARAVYSRASVLLFDDPLSAVDEHVQAHLIEHVFGPDGLLKTKTVIMATNTVNLLRHASTIHLIEDKTFVESGEFAELMSQENGKVKKLVDEFQTAAGDKKTEGINEEADGEDTEVGSSIEDLSAEQQLKKQSFSTLRRASSVSHFSILTLGANDNRRTRVEGEVNTSGAANIVQLYKGYFSAAGWHNIILYVSFTMFGSGMAIISTYWVAMWGSDKIDLNDMQLVLGYLAIGVLAALFDVLGSISWDTFGSLRASRVLHEKMLKAVIRAPMSFFESTPLGRLTSRFSQDIGKIDWMMTWIIVSFSNSLIQSFSTLCVIVLTSPSTLLVIVPALYLYRIIQQYYLATSREARRLSAAAMSPVISHFQETLTGLTTVRAFGKPRYFATKSTARIDARTKARFLMASLQQWLSLRLSAIGVAIFLASGLSLVGTLHWKALSAGLVGLAMSYASTISQSLSEVVRTAITVEQESVVLERINEYCNIEPEAPLKAKEPAAHWPNEGKITFSDYSTKYRANLDPVLKEISFTINPREKIGVVGRTGAGKSSLTMALFRIIEATDGAIIIDGEDISKLGLEDLRSRLSIIPQDAQMFEGTIKGNLDPAGKFTDEQLLEVLEHSSLKKYVDEHDGLDTKLNDGGSNLSLGQKQLMCLGRALLNPSPILVLDEATAAVDYETDKLIQETIRREFKDRTILTIAHRLNTVMDSDRIMVLDAGKVVEFDTPENLLKNEDSFFYSLVNRSKGGEEL